jgi:branched-chain amino acid transport system ATP-binding protein
VAQNVADLRIEQVSVRFGGLLAVENVSAVFPLNGRSALLGPNGAGKTTLFNAITGYVPLHSGRVAVDGLDVSGWPTHRIARAGVARTFQSGHLFLSMTAVENVQVGLHTHVPENWFRTALRLPGFAAAEQASVAEAHRLLDLVGFDEPRTALTSALSLAGQKEVQIARALACQPRLLLLDEPAAGLNTEEKRHLDVTIRRVQSEAGCGILLIEHDVELVMNLAERVLVLEFGRRLVEGTPEEVKRHPDVLRAYLGDDYAA